MGRVRGWWGVALLLGAALVGSRAQEPAASRVPSSSFTATLVATTLGSEPIYDTLRARMLHAHRPAADPDCSVHKR